MHKLHTADYIVFLLYFVVVSAYGYYVYQKKKSATPDSKDFFLAEGSLTWWAIGAVSYTHLDVYKRQVLFRST